MDVYLYCSYTNAKLGFCMTRLEEDGLAPACPDSGGAGRQINEFFLCDRFRVLWLEYPPEDGGLLPEIEGGLFGMRSLRGAIEGRTAVANFMLQCQRSELLQMEAAVRGILADPVSFAAGLFARLSIGGPCGYTASGDALRGLLEIARQRGSEEETLAVEPFLSATAAEKALFLPRKYLRFAVYVTSWEQACEQFRPKFLWQSCPKQAISEAEFLALYPRPF